jgi:hypothetical protein
MMKFASLILFFVAFGTAAMPVRPCEELLSPELLSQSVEPYATKIRELSEALVPKRRVPIFVRWKANVSLWRSWFPQPLKSLPTVPPDLFTGEDTEFSILRGDLSYRFQIGHDIHSLKFYLRYDGHRLALGDEGDALALYTALAVAPYVRQVWLDLTPGYFHQLRMGRFLERCRDVEFVRDLNLPAMLFVERYFGWPVKEVDFCTPPHLRIVYALPSLEPAVR